jgi:tagaturonate epimerase
MNPGKYSMGIGDRFGHQGPAQLRAIESAAAGGTIITPVWNKSNREHLITRTHPEAVRKEADETVRAAGFTRPYFVDADHINLDTVDRFIRYSDYFTMDVAAYIGSKASDDKAESFISKAKEYIGDLKIEGIPEPFIITPEYIESMSAKYLQAAAMAGEIFRKIAKSKGESGFVAEISIDEVTEAQRPSDLFFILMMLSLEKIPVQTIAPKFSGRFNKGVDYAGDPQKFEYEFESDILVIKRAIGEFGLPRELKLSIHSGSDKFSIYPHIGNMIRKHDCGIHIKTAGTTWLEEVIGLAMAGGEALRFIKEISLEALKRKEELCAPYRDVIGIKMELLPSESAIKKMDSISFADSIRHIPDSPGYNQDFRQLMHVAYKLAASRIEEYTSFLDKYNATVSECVYENLFHRHISRIFGIEQGQIV